MNNREPQLYCTLFDSAYLSRGLALYESLSEHAGDFHLYVLAMDDDCATFLQEKNLPGLSVITLAEFETDALLEIKPGRTRGEYCWTCTPFIIDYCLEKFSLPCCTYLDSDIFFFANPQVLLDEIPPHKSVLITEHHYTPEHDQTRTSGRFCVQFVTFRNTAAGRHILSTWAAQCHEWCFNRMEENRFGDQKYQDAWPLQWPDAVHILQHRGGGVAPWNIQQYAVSRDRQQLAITDASGSSCPIIFYHFHSLLFCNGHDYWRGNYPISRIAKKLIYQPYAENLHRIASSLPVKLPLGPLCTPPNIINRYSRVIRGKRPLPYNIGRVH